MQLQGKVALIRLQQQRVRDPHAAQTTASRQLLGMTLKHIFAKELCLVPLFHPVTQQGSMYCVQLALLALAGPRDHAKSMDL